MVRMDQNMIDYIDVGSSKSEVIVEFKIYGESIQYFEEYSVKRFF